MALQPISTTPALELQANMTTLSDGRIVATWFDNPADKIFARIFNSDGTPAGGEFEVQQYSGGRLRAPEVVAKDDGGFLIFWRATGIRNSVDGQGHHLATDLVGRSYDSSGTAEGNEKIIIPYDGNNNHGGGGIEDTADTDAVVLSNGKIMVTYMGSDGGAGQTAIKTVILNQDMTVHENPGTVFRLTDSYGDGYANGREVLDMDSIETDTGKVIHVQTNEQVSAGHSNANEPVVFVRDAATGVVTKQPFYPADGVSTVGSNTEQRLLALGVDKDPVSGNYVVLIGSYTNPGQPGFGEIKRVDMDGDGNIISSSTLGNIPGGVNSDMNFKFDSTGNIIVTGGNFTHPSGASAQQSELRSWVFFANGDPMQVTVHETGAFGDFIGQEIGGTTVTWLPNGNLAVMTHQAVGTTNRLAVISVPNTTGPPGGAPCFVRGTLILTDRGEVAVEDLRAGDMILTADNGMQVLRWIGSSKVPARGKTAPVRIKTGAFGAKQDLLVSQQHRIVINGSMAELMFGESEVLVPAKALVNDQTVLIETGGRVEYFHLMFDQHEIIYANGALSESFHPGAIGMRTFDAATRQEIFDLFPELEVDTDAFGPTARISVKVKEAGVLNALKQATQPLDELAH